MRKSPGGWRNNGTFNESLVEAIAHHHDEKWKLNPKLGRILFYANRFVSGLVDFNECSSSSLKPGMHFPLNWHFNELERVEEIFREEMSKASSLMNAPSAEKPSPEKA